MRDAHGLALLNKGRAPLAWHGDLQQCGEYPTLMTERRQYEGQRPLGDVVSQAALGHSGQTTLEIFGCKALVG